MLADCGVWYKMTKSRDTTNNRTGFLVVIKEGRYGFDQQKEKSLATPCLISTSLFVALKSTCKFEQTISHLVDMCRAISNPKYR